MTIKADTAIAKVPLWLFPIILFSLVGLTSLFVLGMRFMKPGDLGPVVGWLLAPQRISMTGYTLMAVFVAGVIWRWAVRGGFADRIVPFARPSAKYWVWAVAAFVVSWATPPAWIQFIMSLGLRGRSYDITDPPTFALVTVWAVVLGPACEEILFRGFGIGHLIARGLNRWLAGGIVLVFFLLMHWPHFGLGGVLLVLPFSLLVTLLRLVSGNLTPGLIFHVLNNIAAFLVLPMLWAM